jgi:large repetitive protein
MADVITDLTDDDIKTEWRTAHHINAQADEDAADADQDAADADEDAADADEDAADADQDATDSGDADGTDA